MSFFGTGRPRLIGAICRKRIEKQIADIQEKSDKKRMEVSWQHVNPNAVSILMTCLQIIQIQSEGQQHVPAGGQAQAVA